MTIWRDNHHPKRSQITTLIAAQTHPDCRATRCTDTTAEQRRPLVEAYWQGCDPDHVDGPGTESFSAMLDRARNLQGRLAAHPAGYIVVFTHGQVMQALRLLAAHPTASDRELMGQFLEFDRRSPMSNGQMLAV